MKKITLIILLILTPYFVFSQQENKEIANINPYKGWSITAGLYGNTRYWFEGVLSIGAHVDAEYRFNKYYALALESQLGYDDSYFDTERETEYTNAIKWSYSFIFARIYLGYFFFDFGFRSTLWSAINGYYSGFLWIQEKTKHIFGGMGTASLGFNIPLKEDLSFMVKTTITGELVMLLRLGSPNNFPLVEFFMGIQQKL